MAIRSPQRVVSCAVLSLLLSGCRGAVEQHLAARYGAEFACPSAEVTDSPGQGFRVEGCNHVAFYYCEPNRGCHLEHSRELTEPEQRAARERYLRAHPQPAEPDEHAMMVTQQLADARKLLVASPGKQQPLGQVASEHFCMELASLPEQQTVLVLRFSTQNELSTGPCRPTFSLDNHVVSNELVGPQSTHEATLLLEAAPLHNMQEALPVRGVVCGVSFSLDEAARRQLANIVGKTARHAP